MSLIYRKGDLLAQALNGDYNIVVHGCNCFHAMGSGIARQIKEQFPDADAADRTTLYGDKRKLGTYSVMLGKRFNIINAYTQFMPSTKKDVFEYKAFEKILDDLAEKYPGCRFGLPYIGMGLARGDPARIMPMIEKFAEKVAKSNGSVTIVEYSTEVSSN